MLLFLACAAFAGWQLSTALWRRFARAPLSISEQLTSAGVVASALILAVTWALALIGQLRFVPLATAGAAFAIAGGVLFWRAPRGAKSREIDVSAPVLVLFYLPLTIWIAFCLWRGAVTPILAHDALVYHMPRAALFYQTGTFQDFHWPDERIDSLPPNYELLLADWLILDHASDRLTEWLSTIYFLLALVATAALARRWWGNDAHVYPTLLFLCSAPVYLLQAPNIKNDIVVMFFFLAAFVFAGRWLRERETLAAALAMIATFLAAGTKPHGVLLGMFLAPLMIAGAMRARREGRFGAAQIAVASAVLIGGTLLLGGMYYVHRMLGSHTPNGAVQSVTLAGYGEWSYLWEVPASSWLAPFSRTDHDVYIPWTGKRWWWSRWDVHDSNYGAAISLLALLIPFVGWWRRDGEEGRVERIAVVAAGVGVGLACLPRETYIHGYVSSYVRYLLYIAALIVAWTVPPLCRRLAAITSPRFAEVALLATGALFFVPCAINVARFDRYTPLPRVIAAARHPGFRGVPLYDTRAETVIDRLAGPTDKVDLFIRNDAWTYPAMGPKLARSLHFISDASQIRPDADWVGLDLWVVIAWQGQGFRDMGDYPRFLAKGAPPPEAVRFVRAMLRDPRFEPVYIDTAKAQAVFRRRL
jgi:hypothetical protein